MRVHYGKVELKDGVKRLSVRTVIDGGEHEGTFFLRGNADAASEFVTTSVEELARDLETVNVNPARAVDLATVVTPVYDERLRRMRVVRMDIWVIAVELTCPTGPSIQQVTVWVWWLTRGSNSTSSSPFVVM